MLFVWLTVVGLLVSCHLEKTKHEKSQCMYPESKIRAHKGNDTAEAKVKDICSMLETDSYGLLVSKNRKKH